MHTIEVLRRALAHLVAGTHTTAQARAYLIALRLDLDGCGVAADDALDALAEDIQAAGSTAARVRRCGCGR